LLFKPPCSNAASTAVSSTDGSLGSRGVAMRAVAQLLQPVMHNSCCCTQLVPCLLSRSLSVTELAW
jgi:hypothetical protein